ncbi:bifunctional nuclease family protein [bacterium]|nr:bifunctional nuclease family protein [bacterium]
MALHKMKVYKLGIGLITHDPILILLEEDGTRSLPINIGVFEASSIAFVLEKTELARPITHDIVKDIIDNLQAEVKQVNIDKIVGDTFYATLVLEHDGKEINIDTRPSDGIAIALRTASPIYANEELLHNEGVQIADLGLDPNDRTEESSEETKETENYDAKDIEDYIQNLDPNDFDSEG